MNSLNIACLIITFATALVLYQGMNHRSDQKELQKLRTDERTLRNTIAEYDARTSEASRRSSDHRSELNQINAELRAISDEIVRTAPVPDPEIEGRWPVDRPYFHLPKRLLDQISYSMFTADGKPTEETKILFGLTPHEREMLWQAWTDFRSDLQELQIRSAERLPDGPVVANSVERSVRFHMHDLTQEHAGLRSRLDARIEHYLGLTRARLLADPLDEQISNLTSPLGDREVIITYRADRQTNGSIQHYLSFSDPAGTVMYNRPVEFQIPNPPLNYGESPAVIDTGSPLSPDSALWNYRHLFGDQPLLSPP
jgi:hypothetical protein